MDGLHPRQWAQEEAEHKRLPETSAQDARQRAEELLGGTDADVQRAVAFALLAVAGELHEIRTLLRRKR